MHLACVVQLGQKAAINTSGADSGEKAAVKACVARLHGGLADVCRLADMGAGDERFHAIYLTRAVGFY